MDASAAVAKGNQAFVDENFTLAEEMYTLAIELEPQESVAFSNRAAVHLHNKKFTKALEDLNEAIRLDQSREVCHFRKGVTCFELGEYEAAKKAFERGAQLINSQEHGEHTRKYAMWIRKCNVEIENDTEDVAPMDQTVPDAQPAPVALAPAPAVPAAAAPVSAAEPPATPPVPKWNFYQSADKVTVTIFAKDLDPMDAKISIKPRHLKVILRLDRKNKVDVLVLDTPLFARVASESARMRYLSTKLEIVLPKEEQIQWPTLEGEAEPAAVATTPAPEATQTAVPRPYASRRDWETIERELKKQEEEEKPEGDEALHKLFRDIYSKGSDETRRAMIKSFQTSGGTVLSTNWGEVQEKDYEQERTAPNGMLWKDWEGNKLPQKDT